MSKLQDKVAVVTGGNSGIGFSTAKALRDEGARVVIVGRDRSNVDAAVEELGEGTVGLTADVAKVEELDRLFSEIKRRFDRIDVLFANAGVAPVVSIAETDEKTFDTLFDVNVKGVYFTIQKALPLMAEGASIIINSSVANRIAVPGFSAYAGTKAAVRAIASGAAAELAPRKIRVNVVSPGPIDTPLFGKTGLSQEQVDTFAEAIQSQVPLGRFGRPDEVAAAVVFLASSEAGYVTGSEITVDGGMTQV